MDRYYGSIVAVIISVILIIIFALSFVPKIEKMKIKAEQYNNKILSILE